MEDRARGDRELPPAAGAFPTGRRLGKRVDLGRAAVRAERLAAVRGESDPLEDSERFLVGQPENLSEVQAPCGCGEEEVRHGDLPSETLLMYCIWRYLSPLSSIANVTYMMAFRSPRAS
jgi:hypothetical protein